MEQVKISDCRMRIADLKQIANPILQSEIRNLKSAIYFAPDYQSHSGTLNQISDLNQVYETRKRPHHLSA